MWEYIKLPGAADDPGEREKLIEQFTVEKMREYDGTVFFCISRSDRERRLTFRQAAWTLHYMGQDGRAVCTAYPTEKLVNRPGRNVLFVEPSMQEYLGEYLDACPAGARHLLLYSRRKSNGACLCMSMFMDFWQERGVDIWDLHEVDKVSEIPEKSEMEEPL